MCKSGCYSICAEQWNYVIAGHVTPTPRAQLCGHGHTTPQQPFATGTFVRVPQLRNYTPPHALAMGTTASTLLHEGTTARASSREVHSVWTPHQTTRFPGMHDAPTPSATSHHSRALQLHSIVLRSYPSTLAQCILHACAARAVHACTRANSAASRMACALPNSLCLTLQQVKLNRNPVVYNPGGIFLSTGPTITPNNSAMVLSSCS